MTTRQDQEIPEIVPLVEQKLQAAKRRVAELDQAQRDIFVERRRWERVIDACQTLLADEKEQSVDAETTTAPTEKIRQAHMWQSTGRKPGNRNPIMPPRVERFQNTSIQKAIETLAAEFGVARHAKDFARGIYKIETREGLSMAVRGVTRAALNLVEDGVLLKVTRNTFIKKERPGEQASQTLETSAGGK